MWVICWAACRRALAGEGVDLRITLVRGKITEITKAYFMTFMTFGVLRRAQKTRAETGLVSG